MAGEIPRQEEGVRRLLWLVEAGVVKYLQVRVIAKYVVTTNTGTMIRRAMMKRTRAAMRSPSEGGGWLGACGQKSIDMPVQTSVVVGYRDIDKGRGEREEDLGRRPGCHLARYAFLYQRKCNASMCRKGTDERRSPVGSRLRILGRRISRKYRRVLITAAQVGLTPDNIQRLGDLSVEEEEQRRKDSLRASKLRQQFQASSDRDLSPQQIVLLFAQQEVLRPEDVIDYGLRAPSPSKRFAIQPAILTRLHMAMRGLQVYLSELAKETRLRVTLNQIYVIDPANSLYDILRGAGTIAILATAWSVLASRLAHGLALSEKYYQQALNLQVSSPASTIAGVYDTLNRNATPETTLRDHLAKLPSLRRLVEDHFPGATNEQLTSMPLTKLLGVDEGVLRAFPSTPPATPYTYDDQGNKAVLSYFERTSVNAAEGWEPPATQSSSKGKQKSVAFDVASESSAYTHDAPLPSPEVLYKATPTDYSSYYTAPPISAAAPTTPYKTPEALFTPNPSIATAYPTTTFPIRKDLLTGLAATPSRSYAKPLETGYARPPESASQFFTGVPSSARASFKAENPYPEATKAHDTGRDTRAEESTCRSSPPGNGRSPPNGGEPPSGGVPSRGGPPGGGGSPGGGRPPGRGGPPDGGGPFGGGGPPAPGGPPEPGGNPFGGMPPRGNAWPGGGGPPLGPPPGPPGGPPGGGGGGNGNGNGQNYDPYFNRPAAMIPRFEIKYKPNDAPGWDGNKKTVIRYFMKVQEFARKGGYIPYQLGQMLADRFEEGSAIESWYLTLTDPLKDWMDVDRRPDRHFII
ncbi:hypothetical protein EIP86_008922 [Pleurotus ostreatoroseus]|nr:hypothetical protein EIP86_008922 [Pleurotus ostreatoroseus]